MANEINQNGIITVQRLQQFKNLLLGQNLEDQNARPVVYTADYIDKNFANIHGNGKENFKASYYQIYGTAEDEPYIKLSYFRGSDKVSLLLHSSTDGNNISIPLYGTVPNNIQRRVLTNADFVPEDVVLKSEFDSDKKANAVVFGNTRLCSDSGVMVYSKLVAAQGAELSVTISENDTLSVSGTSSVAVGDIIYVDSVQNLPNDGIYTARVGFYYVTEARIDGNTSVGTAILKFVCSKSNKMIYYNKTEEALGYFNAGAFVEISTGSGGGGDIPEGYTIATDADINGIFD